MHILHVVGARPNFMKAAPVLHALGKRPAVEATLVHTGPALRRQHVRCLFFPA